MAVKDGKKAAIAGLPFAVAIVLALVLIPVVPTKAATFSAPSTAPAANTGILKDPTGTYQFAYLGNGTYAMNYTAYQKLLKDPFSGVSGSVKIEGNTVLIAVPASNVVSAPPHDSPAAAPEGFVSVTSWLVGYGAVFVNGGYHLEGR